MSDAVDAQLQLKKRARRRLIGAIAFAGLAAVVLPMVMDQEPKQQVQDVQIRIPGQDLPPPHLARSAEPPARAPESLPPAPAERAVVAAPAAEKMAEKPVEKAVEQKAAEKPAEKAAEKKTEKPAEKAKNSRSQESDAQRAAAILAGKMPDEPVKQAANGSAQYVVLIGAFSNPANVKQLQSKLGELSIPVFTEPLDTPDGRKTRVRAGPFSGRESAERALDKMKRIGVGGVVAAKQ